jgi:hypothetical protein
MGLGIMNIGKKQRINESWEYMLEHNSQHYSQDISLHIPYIFSIFLKINLKKIRKKEEKKASWQYVTQNSLTCFPTIRIFPRYFPIDFPRDSHGFRGAQNDGR